MRSIAPPPGSYNRDADFYLALSKGEVDPNIILEDIKHYNKQVDELINERYELRNKLNSLNKELGFTLHQLEDLNKAITKGQEIVVASTKSYILCKEKQESKNA
jgi:hypothetical protein